jgi:hypothetical protein
MRFPEANNGDPGAQSMSANGSTARMRARMRRLRTGAAVLGVFASVLAWGASAGPAAAAQSANPTAAFFVDATGTLNAYGTDSSGAWSSAAPAGPVKLAEPGVPIAAAFVPGGHVMSVFVVGDGSLDMACWPNPVPTRVFTGPFTQGSTVGVEADGTVVTVAVVDPGSSVETFLQDSHDPCTDPKDPFIVAGSMPVPGYTGAPMAITGLANGAVGTFTSDSTGALHAVWLSGAGALSTSVLTSSGTIGAGGGIAAAPGSGATTVSLFYAGANGLVYLAQTGENPGAIPWAPHPEPWGTGAATTAGGMLTATTAIAGRTDVGYVATDGVVLDLTADGAGDWLSAAAVTAAGFASPGEPIASSATTADAGAFDLFCAAADGRPYHLPISPGGPGPGPGGSAGPTGQLGRTTRLGAA